MEIKTRSDGAEMTFNYTIADACVTRADNPGVRYTGPDTPTIDSWKNHQAGWRIIGGRSIATKVENPLGQVAEQRYDANGT